MDLERRVSTGGVVAAGSESTDDAAPITVLTLPAFTRALTSLDLRSTNNLFAAFADAGYRTAGVALQGWVGAVRLAFRKVRLRNFRPLSLRQMLRTIS